MILKLVGVTFATDKNPELKQLRPSGSVSFEAEPDNETDPNAVKVMYKGQPYWICTQVRVSTEDCT